MISIYRKKTIENLPASHLSHGWESVECNDLDALENLIIRFPWSPCIWKDGLRRKNNFISAKWCALDFDDNMTLSEAKDIFIDTEHLIGITKSHQIAKGNNPARDRFRVVLRFEELISNKAVYEASMDLAIKHHDADRACKDAARFFWPCKKIVQVNAGDFFFQDVVKDPALVSRYESKELDLSHPFFKQYKSETLSKFAMYALEYGAAEGQRNLTMFKVAIELFRKDYPEQQIYRRLYERFGQKPRQKSGYESGNNGGSFKESADGRSDRGGEKEASRILEKTAKAGYGREEKDSISDGISEREIDSIIRSARKAASKVPVKWIERRKVE